MICLSMGAIQPNENSYLDFLSFDDSYLNADGRYVISPLLQVCVTHRDATEHPPRLSSRARFQTTRT